MTLAMHLPYAWIVPICVAGALCGHIVLTRALLMRRTDTEGATLAAPLTRN